VNLTKNTGLITNAGGYLLCGCPDRNHRILPCTGREKRGKRKKLPKQENFERTTKWSWETSTGGKVMIMNKEAQVSFYRVLFLFY